jgi:hypothetical protein
LKERGEVDKGISGEEVLGEGVGFGVSSAERLRRERSRTTGNANRPIVGGFYYVTLCLKPAAESARPGQVSALRSVTAEFNSAQAFLDSLWLVADLLLNY